MFFYALATAAAALVWLGRRRLTGFDIAVLALTFAGGVSAIRGCHGSPLPAWSSSPSPSGTGSRVRALASRGAGSTSWLRRASRPRSSSSPARSFSATRPGSRTTGRAKPSMPCSAELGPDDRMFAPDRFADWMLFKIPELRGRIAYDIRFEVYDEDFFARLQDYDFEDGAELEVSRGRVPHRHPRRAPHVACEGLPRRARRACHLPGRRMTIVADRPADLAAASPEDDDAVALEDLPPGRVTLEPARELPHLPGTCGGAATPGRRPRIPEVEQCPGGSDGDGHRGDVPTRREVRAEAVVATPRHRRDQRDSLVQRRTCALEYTGRPPNGARRPARPRPEHEPDENRPRDSRRRKRPTRAEIRATPKTVAPTRNGTTASTLWYRGSVIDGKSDSMFARAAATRRPRGRREEEQPAERDREPQEVGDVGTREQRTEHSARIGEERLDHALRRAADLVVEAVVALEPPPCAAGTTTRSRRTSREPARATTRSGDPLPPGERVPESEPDDRTPSTRRSTSRAPRRARTGRAGRVEEPEAVEEQRDGEGHRMDRRRGARRDPRVREVGERSSPATALSRVPPPEPEHRKRPQRDHDDLRERKRERRGPQRSTAAPAARGTDRHGAEPNDLLPRRTSVVSSTRPCDVLQTA